MKKMTEKEPSYQRIDNGEVTTADDPARGVWYPAGSCGYWTDDWSKLGNRGGIPCCPHCGCPGMQTTAKNWFDGAEKFEKDDHPHYCAFLADSKEHCAGRGASSFMQRYEEFAAERA